VAFPGVAEWGIWENRRMTPDRLSKWIYWRCNINLRWLNWYVTLCSRRRSINRTCYVLCRKYVVQMFQVDGYGIDHCSTFALFVTILNEVFDDGKFSTTLIERFDLRCRNGKLPWFNILQALHDVSVGLLFAVKAASAILQTKEAKMSLAQLVPALNRTTTVKVIKCLWFR